MAFLKRFPDALQRAAALHQRLSLSGADFKHALRISDRILRTKPHHKYHGVNAEVLRGLNCSMVMAYTRPFCGAQSRRGENVPPLPGRILRLLTQEEHRVHRAAMRSRNKFLAHTDADAVALQTVVVKFPNGRETLVNIGADRLAPLDEEATKALASAAKKLLEATQSAATDLEVHLRPYFRTCAPENLIEFVEDA